MLWSWQSTSWYGITDIRDLDVTVQQSHTAVLSFGPCSSHQACRSAWYCGPSRCVSFCLPLPISLPSLILIQRTCRSQTPCYSKQHKAGKAIPSCIDAQRMIWSTSTQSAVSVWALPCDFQSGRWKSRRPAKCTRKQNSTVSWILGAQRRK